MGSYATSLSRAETANRAADDLVGERISGYGLGQPQLEEFHRSRAATVLAADAQLLAFETIPDLVEARAIAAVLEQLQAQQGAVPIEAWVTFTCRDGGAGDGICDHGDLFEDCVRAVAGCSAIVGCGFNCTEPHLAPMLLRTARAIVGDDKLLVCYPNSGEMYLLRAIFMSTWGFWPAVFRPLRTFFPGLGAGFLNLAGQTERTAKKRGKTSKNGREMA
eukprot:COSAG04_NODE_155_length_22379_cov_5.613707_11_plen_219_part_00